MWLIEKLLKYKITCIQRPPKGSNKSGLLQQVVFKCMFYEVDLRRGVVSEQWSLNPFPNIPRFLHVSSTSLLKTLWEKEKLLVTSNFSFSHSVFYLFWELYATFIKFKIVICKLFQFGRV